MPAQTVYDHELVFEQAEFYARRHGEATLELQSGEMLISAANTPGDAACGLCAHALGPLSFATKGRRLCARCARKHVR